jgi:hypothetical protein
MCVVAVLVPKNLGHGALVSDLEIRSGCPKHQKILQKVIGKIIQ